MTEPASAAAFAASPSWKFSVEALHVAQHRTALKPDETKAYASALVQAIACLAEAKAALEKALERMN